MRVENRKSNSKQHCLSACDEVKQISSLDSDRMGGHKIPRAAAEGEHFERHFIKRIFQDIVVYEPR